MLVSINKSVRKLKWVFVRIKKGPASCAATYAENILTPAACLPLNEEITYTTRLQRPDAKILTDCGR
jgi:hypothetical protein